MEYRNEVFRGDIYYLQNDFNNSIDPKAGRPVIIVSNDLSNKFSPYVEIVPLTSQAKKDSPTHVEIQCRVPSTALCENIKTITKSHLGDLIRTCTESEMKNINNALLESLGLTGCAPKNHASEAEVECKLYKSLYEQLLNKLIGGK